MRRLLALVLGAVVVMGLPTNTLAFHTLGGKWASICCSNTTYWIYSSGVDSTAWQTGVNSWKNTNTPIWIVSSGKADTEDIGLVSTNNNSVTWDGLTFLSPSNTANPYTYATAYLNDHFTNGYVAAKRQSVSEHELGHVFGLAHTSGAVLMNPATCGANSRWCTFSINTPQGDDVNGINAIY